jgi:hypothetical protein
MRTSILIGWGITLLYFISLFSLYNCYTPEKIEFKDLGSFISGALTPLVLIWAIIGYMIQAKDSSENLKYIKIEKERRESNSISKFDFSNFYTDETFDPDEGYAYKVNFELENYGQEAKDLIIKTSYDLEKKNKHKKPSSISEIKNETLLTLDKNKKYKFEHYLFHEIKNEIKISIIYTDIISRKWSLTYLCTASDYHDDDSSYRYFSSKLVASEEVK